jgi:peptide/nickel transport system substrate-binding protein
MYSPRFRIRLGALAALIALTAGACSKASPSAAPTPSSAPPTAVTTAWPADVTSLDPANDSTNQDHTLNRNIYETLLSTKFAEQSDGTLKFVGANVTADLAQSWDLGPDSVTFHLRPGVTFYGTTDTVTAETVKWSLGRVWSTPGVGDFQANGLQKPDQIQIVDPLTVKINFVDSTGAATPPTRRCWPSSISSTRASPTRIWSRPMRLRMIRRGRSGCAATPRGPVRTTSPIASPA